MAKTENLMRFLVMLTMAAISLCAASVARAQSIFWVDSSFPAPILHRSTGGGSSLVTLALAPRSLPQGIAMQSGGHQLAWGELAFSGAHVNRIQDTLMGLNAVVGGLSCVQGVAMDAGGKVYWTSTNLVSGPKIERANLDGSQTEVLIDFGPRSKTLPQGIALDSSQGMMYWCDFGHGRIEKATISVGATPSDVITGLSGPVGIALDHSNGRIYWTERNGGKIRRCNLDGTVQTTLLSGLYAPDHIALDTADNLMFWTEIGTRTVRRAALDGTGITTIISTSGLPTGICLGGTTADVADPVSTALVGLDLRVMSELPSRGTTRVEYDIPRSGRVDLVVADVEGRVVARLVDGDLGAGKYHVVWDGRTDRGEVPAGVYFMRLETDGRKIVRRIILVR